jgi:hypothetical protein
MAADSTIPEVEVIPPGQRPVQRFNAGMIHRPGFVMFTTGVLVGMLVAGVAVYVIKKKL